MSLFFKLFPNLLFFANFISLQTCELNFLFREREKFYVQKLLRRITVLALCVGEYLSPIKTNAQIE